jgi:Na+-transporting methylmalonyl-CoA/oxaloacetate decarboxylase gamma subunit
MPWRAAMSEWKSFVRRMKNLSYFIISVPVIVWGIQIVLQFEDWSVITIGLVFLFLGWLIAVGAIKLISWIASGRKEEATEERQTTNTLDSYARGLVIGILKVEITKLRQEIEKNRRTLNLHEKELESLKFHMSLNSPNQSSERNPGETP